MITVIHIGQHELRLAEPALVALRCCGHLVRSEVLEILHLIREHLKGREARILIDVSELGNVHADWRQELDRFARELESEACPSRHLALIGSNMLHKVILAPLLCRTGGGSGPRLYLHFCQSYEAALLALHLAAAELFDSKGSIYLTQSL